MAIVPLNPWMEVCLQAENREKWKKVQSRNSLFILIHNATPNFLSISFTLMWNEAFYSLLQCNLTQSIKTNAVLGKCKYMRIQPL